MHVHYSKSRLKYIFSEDIRTFDQMLLDKKVPKTQKTMSYISKSCFKSVGISRVDLIDIRSVGISLDSLR